MKKAPELPDRLRWRDYFQIVTTVLMLGLGSYILWETIFVRWAIPSLIFSVAMLLYSMFRAKMIWTYFRHKGKKHAT